MFSLLAHLRSLVLPAGVQSGTRLVLDGDTGRISVYDALNVERTRIDSATSTLVVGDAAGTGARVIVDGTTARVQAVDQYDTTRLVIDSAAASEVLTLSGLAGSSLALSTSAGTVGAGLRLSPPPIDGHTVGAAELSTALSLRVRPQLRLTGPQLDGGDVASINLYSSTGAQGSDIEVMTDVITVAADTFTIDALHSALTMGITGNVTVTGDLDVTGKITQTGTAWAPFTPTWSSASNPQPSFGGNSTLNCRWKQFGKTVHALYDIAFGSQATYGNGIWTFGLPTTAKAVNPAHIGSGISIQSSTRVLSGVELSTTSGIIGISSTGAIISNTSPFTWASGNTLRFAVTYEYGAA